VEPDKEAKVNCVVSQYLTAKKIVNESGYQKEIEWQEQVIKQTFTESDLLREAAWVILCSGFKESIVRKKFNLLSLCFWDWESCKKIIDSRANTLECALAVFANKKKLEAILSTAEKISQEGFNNLKKRIYKDPINTLKGFDYIGDITAYHLAKNIGINIAKPDRHLFRIAEAANIGDTQKLCSEISKRTNDPIAVVDIVLWRYATIVPNYLQTFLAV